MGFSIKRAALGFATGGLSEVPGLAKKAGLGGTDPTGKTQYDKEREDAIKARMAGLQKDLDATKGPQMLANETTGYQARTTSPALEAALAKQKTGISQQYNAGAQTASDAINRRFAAMGAGGSGSAIKATERVFSDATDKSVQAQTELESQARAQFGEQEANKEFQSMEAVRGRNAAREQFNSDAAFKDQVFRFDSKSKLAQLELGFIQADRDAQDQAFNKEMAQYQQKHSGGLLGSGGFLGTGIGI